MTKTAICSPSGGKGEESRRPCRLPEAECHIEPDWLPIYKVDGDDLYLVRTGTFAGRLVSPPPPQ